MSQLFADRVLRWFEQHGRKALPWQQSANPYRVWVSEIMLQQTRVETVLPYFNRFIDRFPAVENLASATKDEVMHYWSGLGYYARARNMHKAAQLIMSQHQGRFPADLSQLEALPGIGRSTAGAILSLGMQKKASILDGNVKRVLARHAGIVGWTASAATARQLWSVAEQRTPERKFAAYNQAMMDLGALLCTRINPQCTDCPVSGDCVANLEGKQHMLPTPKPKAENPLKKVAMLIVVNNRREALLQRRGEHGIWGGLWSFPEFASANAAKQWFCKHFGDAEKGVSRLPCVTHAFTHFRLQIRPMLIHYDGSADWVMEDNQWLWYNKHSSKVGLAAPVARLIAHIE